MSLREVAEVGAVNLSVDGIRVCLKVEPSRWSSRLGFSALRVGATMSYLEGESSVISSNRGGRRNILKLVKDDQLSFDLTLRYP